MGEMIYKPLIDKMTWSYSRAKSFDDCKYKWYLKYIQHIHGDSGFFATYGTFIHKIIDLHYKEGLTPKQMQSMYLKGFRDEVTGEAPNDKIFMSYFSGGLNYLKGFEPFPFDLVETEMGVRFSINDIPIVGYIDFLGKDGDDFVVIDNKSRALKPRSFRAKPTKMDEELDSYLRQLYLYSAAVEEKYGKLPTKLCFNCFRTQTFIEEPFDQGAYEDARRWFSAKVAEIAGESEWKPNVEEFKCTNLCECNHACEYYDLIKR